MEKKELYTFTGDEIVGAFAKEGIEISRPDYDMGCICYSVRNGKDKEKALREKYGWDVAEHVIAKNLVGKDTNGYLFCPDGDQNLPGEFNFVPIYE